MELEAGFVEYERTFASLFGNISFKPNNHRASHIFRQVIMFGRPFNFSMFGFESANIIAPEGVSGTKNPLDSIVRHHDNMLLYLKSLSALLESECFLTHLKDSFTGFFPKLVQSGDKNPRKLIKLYQPEQTGTSPKVKFHLEQFNPAAKGKLNDSFIEFRFGELESKVGKVLFINKEGGFVIASELTKIKLATDFRDSFFRAEEVNRTFQVALDDINCVFGSVSSSNKLFLFRTDH